MAQTVSKTILNKGQDPMFRFSEIASLLQGRLTETEINDLLIGLLSQSIEEVYPGDLISAEWAMNLVHRLERLELNPAETPAYIAKVATCLGETVSFYDMLLVKAAFIPADTTDVSAKTIMQATGVLQRVINVALAGAAIVTLANNQQLLGVFKALYDAQSDLASLLSSDLLGSNDAGPRNSFAALLKAQLDSDQGAVVSLKTALNQGSLDAAVLAQNRINGIVMNYAGDVTIGGLRIIYMGSNGAGRVLSLNDRRPIQYTFKVWNKTNKTLDIIVSAAFRKPREEWSSSVSIPGATEYKALARYDSNNATDTKAFRMIDVLVRTPGGAADKETGILDLIVDVPAPISITNSGSVDLIIGPERIPEGSSWVRFTEEPDPHPPNSTDVSVQISHKISFQFHGTDSTISRMFKVSIDVTSPDTDQLFQFAISQESISGGAAPVIDPPPETLRTHYESKAFEVTSDDERTFMIDVVPSPDSSEKTLVYTVNITSIDGVLQPSAVQTITINVNKQPD